MSSEMNESIEHRREAKDDVGGGRRCAHDANIGLPLLGLVLAKGSRLQPCRVRQRLFAQLLKLRPLWPLQQMCPLTDVINITQRNYVSTRSLIQQLCEQVLQRVQPLQVRFVIRHRIDEEWQAIGEVLQMGTCEREGIERLDALDTLKQFERFSDQALAARRKILVKRLLLQSLRASD